MRNSDSSNVLHSHRLGVLSMNDRMKTPLEFMIYYKTMERTIPNSGMFREVMWQYADMARGGDGGNVDIGDNAKSSCREIYYENRPDEFFQEVCALMCWPW